LEPPPGTRRGAPPPPIKGARRHCSLCSTCQ